MQSVSSRTASQTAPITGALRQWAYMLRSAMPGIVVSFDPVKQTCVVQPAIQEIVMLPPPASTGGAAGAAAAVGSAGATGPVPFTQNIPTPVTIKPLLDVPIFMMRVPGWSITLPIAEGTECLLIFNDSCIDGWWQSGGVQPQMDRRRHDLSDAMALFGPWSQPNVLTSYSTTSMQIRSDDLTVVVDLKPGQITVTAPTVDVAASTAANITSPAVKILNTGGTPLALMNDTFYQWFASTVMPFLISKGFSGTIPAGSETTVLEAQ
jgi:Phage protein Gp138 N-terminal domain